MGILSDILEDNIERIGDFRTGDFYVLRSGIKYPFQQPQPTFVECPLCALRLISKDLLEQHLITKHAKQHIYLRADDKIIHSFACLKKLPDILEIVLLGIKNARLIIEGSELPSRSIDFSEKILINPYLGNFVSGELRLKIEFVTGFPRQFNIFIGGIPNLNHDKIDQYALKYLFLPLNLREEPNWSDFSESFLKPELSTIDYQYASGFHDYALGFYMIQSGREGKEHFENALGLLLPFATSFTLTAQRVLALRMNCFALLRECGQSSRFFVANLFFNDPESRFNSQTKPLDWSPQEYGVYLDNFTEIFLDALSAYYSTDYGVLDELCAQLEKSLSFKDRNNMDKLSLLCARKAIIRKQFDIARINYERLHHHPDFGIEAKEMLG